MKIFSISWKLFFIFSILWIIPIIGWYGSLYLERELEEFSIVENKQTAKHHHSFYQKLLKEDDAFSRQLSQTKNPKEVMVAQRVGPILIDGYADEWFPYNDNQLEARNDNVASKLTLIEDKNFIYGLLQINDNNVTYRLNPYTSTSSDMLRLDLGYGYWLFQAIAPGRLKVQKEHGNGFKTINPILAIWQETKSGYAIEFRAPKSLAGNKISAVLYDVDNEGISSFDEKLQGVFTFTDFSYFPLSRELNNSWLVNNELQQSQITLINSSGQVVLQFGDLFSDESYINDYKNKKIINDAFTKEVIEKGSFFSVKNGGNLDFLSKTGHQLVLNGEAVGSIIIESSLLKEKLFLAKLRWFGLLIFSFIWLVLMVLAVKQIKKYRARIAFLNELTEQANEADAEAVNFSELEIYGNDEIDQLSHNLIYYNERLEQRREHQKKLLARLNHELRTPIAIISSSLDNLQLSDLSDDDLELVNNARSGQQRLSLSFNRLSEANRLEESIDQVNLDWFDVSNLLETLVSSYENNWEHIKFNYSSDTNKYKIYGSEDLFAQMLDKIISNAVDFATSNTPIEIKMYRLKGQLSLTIENQGPQIKASSLRNIFNLMESYRSDKDGSNLGLGLYVAKLIARRHKAKISAINTQDGGGVMIQLTWKKKSYLVVT